MNVVGNKSVLTSSRLVKMMPMILINAVKAAGNNEAALTYKAGYLSKLSA